MNSPLRDLLGVDRATVSAVVAARVAASPEAPFVFWDDEAFTYADAFVQIRRFAGWLEQTLPPRVTPARGRTVAGFLANCPAALWTWLGTLHTGAVYAPLNYGHRGPILKDMLDRSGADVLVTDPDGLAAMADLDLGSVKSIVLAGRVDKQTAGSRTVVPWSTIENAPLAGPEPAQIAPAEPAMVVYTSGTTGRSKAVLMSHNQLCRGASATARSLGIGASDVFHAWLPLFHVAGQVDCVLCTMIPGGAIALQRSFSLSQFWDEVGRSGATIFAGFSNVLELLWRRRTEAPDRHNSLRVGMIGGIPKDLKLPFEERFGVRLCDVFGLTEAEPLALPEPDVAIPPGACGRVNPDFEIAVHHEDGTEVEAGGVGEIVARPKVPDVMFIGYEDDDGATLASLRNLWFHTGDLGRLDDDGFLYFIDRRRHAIRRKGENVSSWELEAIINEHPRVVECCAVPIPSPLGEDDIKVALVLNGDDQFAPPEFIDWCTDRMASFMVPRFVSVMPVLPRSEAGKVLKEQVKDYESHLWDAGAANVAGVGTDLASRRTSMESTGVFRRPVAGTSPERVDETP